MLSTYLRWGAVSGGVMLVVAALGFLFIGRLDASTYGIAEIAGYTSIILGLAAIWFAVARRFRVTPQPPASGTASVSASASPLLPG